MTIGLLLITHNDIGAQLLLAAKSTYGSIPIRTEVLSIDHYDQPSDLTKLTKQYIKLLDQGNGVLILTDMFGSTPSNIGKEFSHLKSVNIVSGINLSMLLHIFNYPKFNLKELTAKAIEGGKNGVIQIKNERKKSNNIK
ncbi:MAG: PTS mannose transporter subunit IIA [Gammaproteobacteria bacterium]|jgi:mannose PTS system EIIA component|nr:PTS mannose transporter subunit IIA [Gammaproteobacteria bacterium]MBT4462914.1 PTS mannose transporter subunit IIA [Gammaproteobacteria bacterium]MBT4654663.1 PTS mannose transporter subunit IIA [Gammaproteobacteria bacterium]MBT5116350.1 PTS mannose transporter subunit IIA [Gammaproteobacteria bacterium]MBT5761349.1 PTS mannose transporter subunit IIA [Gammaproteobacteria bacterium]